MADLCRLNFYADMSRYHESVPCRHHPISFSTLVDAERIAVAELVEVQQRYGAAAGYVVLDEAGFEVTSGGGLPNDA